MSIYVMSKVWKYSQHRGSELLVLLAIADFANDDGVAWPSIPTISHKARIGRSQTYDVIRHLIETDELELLRQGGGRQSNKYRVLVRETGPRPEMTPRPVDRTPAVRESGPEPSLEPSVPSLLREGRDAPSPASFVAFLAEELQEHERPLTKGRKARYGREFKELLEKGVDPKELDEAARRIAERWGDYELSVALALADVQSGKATKDQPKEQRKPWEPINPHSDEAIRYRDQPRKPEWYMATMGISGTYADDLMKRHDTHSEIMDELTEGRE